MDRKKLLEESSHFTGLGECYIHTQKSGNKAYETVLCGGRVGILGGIGAELDRLSEKFGTSFMGIVQEMIDIHHYGVEATLGDLQFKDTRVVTADEYEDEWTTDIRKQVEKEINDRNGDLTRKLKAALEELDSEKSLRKADYERFQKREEMFKKQIKDLEKRNLSLDHDLQRMEKQIQGEYTDTGAYN